MWFDPCTVCTRALHGFLNELAEEARSRIGVRSFVPHHHHGHARQPKDTDTIFSGDQIAEESRQPLGKHCRCIGPRYCSAAVMKYGTVSTMRRRAR